jgi:hypothetical protein
MITVPGACSIVEAVMPNFAIEMVEFMPYGNTTLVGFATARVAPGHFWPCSAQKGKSR